jgi:hypothetical protein
MAGMDTVWHGETSRVLETLMGIIGRGNGMDICILRVSFLRDVAFIINITPFRANFQDYTHMCQFKVCSIQVNDEANASFHTATSQETTSPAVSVTMHLNPPRQAMHLRVRRP